ncbi:MAG: GGDEF domain-containing protein [Halieaceae bacterium]|nr:GGDEF domain-containing protein [Halieaceae bacterium]
MRSEQSDSTPLSMGAESRRAFWMALLNSDLIPLVGDSGQEASLRNRDTIYRGMLLLMVFSASVIALEGLFLGQLSGWLVFLAVATVLTQLATLIRLVLAGAVLLPPVLTLSAAVLLLVGAVAQGATHHSLWLFPLMVAISALLPTRVALLFGLLTLAAIVLVRGEFLLTFDLAEDTALVATWLLSLSVMRLMTHQAHELTDLALTDALTGAFNRHYLLPQTDRCIADFHRYSRMSTLLMIDIDHFKRINDQFGHGMGDRVLRAVVTHIEDRLRGVDMVFRYGGEEFMVLLAEAGSASAAKVAEELRLGIESLQLIPQRAVTVSIGVCDVSSVASTEDWLAQVDDAMYRAKAEGRNRVVSVQGTPREHTQLSSRIPVWR